MRHDILDSYGPIIESAKNAVNEMTDKGQMKWASDIHNLFQLCELLKTMCAAHSLAALIAMTEDAELIPLAEKAFREAEELASILNMQIPEGS
jgi:hypothetical protein